MRRCGRSRWHCRAARIILCHGRPASVKLKYRGMENGTVRPEEIGTGEPAGTHKTLSPSALQRLGDALRARWAIHSTLPNRLHTLVTQIQRLEGTPAAGRMPMDHKTTIEAPPPVPGQ
jgi:hypothetical protein